MPHLHEDKIKFLEDRSGQKMQDRIFRKMSAEKKIKLASDFFSFAKKLNKLGSHYGTGKTGSDAEDTERFFEALHDSKNQARTIFI